MGGNGHSNGLGGKLILITRGAHPVGEKFMERAVSYGGEVIFTYNPRTDSKDTAYRMAGKIGLQTIKLDPHNISDRFDFFNFLKAKRSISYWVSMGGLAEPNTDSIEDEVSIVNGALSREGILRPESGIYVVAPLSAKYGKFSNGGEFDSNTVRKLRNIQLLAPSRFVVLDRGLSEGERAKRSAERFSELVFWGNDE